MALTREIRSTGKGLLDRLIETRRTTLEITNWLSAEDQMLQSMKEASPAKWHLAHTTWFFETFILIPRSKGYKPFDPRFPYLFNSYYKQVGLHPFRGARGMMSRPTLEEVLRYRTHVEESLYPLVEKKGPELKNLIELGINHEQQHQELILTDIKHAFWHSPLRPEIIKEGASLLNSGKSKHRPRGNSDVSGIPESKWIRHEKKTVQIGHEGLGFSFDNETPRHEALVLPFSIASRPVLNAEYLDFMRDNGYQRPELWLSDGWDWVLSMNARAPLYWEQGDGGEWLQFVLQGRGEPGLRRVDPLEPVCHVNYFEADAFARWAGARLPTEFEWEAASPRPIQPAAFLESFRFHPERALPSAAGRPGMHGMGNVWEWTGSQYLPYPGFKAARGAVGEYNGKFMCNQFVLRGGSCATPDGHIRATYRNFFPPQFQWQFSGLRLAK